MSDSDEFDDFDDAPAPAPAAVDDDESDDSDDSDLDEPAAANPSVNPDMFPTDSGDEFDDFDDDDLMSGINLSSVPEPIKQAEANEDDLDAFDNDGFDDFDGGSPSGGGNSAAVDAAAGDALAGKVLVTEVAVSSAGIGLSIVGPAPEDKEMTGCFVSKVKEMSSAYANGKIKVGMWIIEVNGVDVRSHSKTGCAQLLKKSAGKAKFKLQYCPQAYGKFDNGAELLAAKTRKASRVKAGKPQRRNANQISAENQDKWFVGKQQREACHAAVLSGNFGDFVVREGTKPGTCVIVINDSGIIANLQVKINTGNGNCTLAGQNFQGMDDVIDYLRANPQNSKKEGSPKYVLKNPPAVVVKISAFWDFMAWNSGKLRVTSLPKVAAGAAKAQAVDVRASGRTAKKHEAKPTKPQGKRWSIRGKASPKKEVVTEEKAEPAGPEFQFPVIRVAIAKRDATSFGMTFIGPDASGARRGVFITKVKEGGPAHNEKDEDGTPKIKPGMRILGMNGKSVQEATKAEAVDGLKQGSLTAIMTLQLDPVGFAYYDQGALLAEMRAAGGATAAAAP